MIQINLIKHYYIIVLIFFNLGLASLCNVQFDQRQVEQGYFEETS